MRPNKELCSPGSATSCVTKPKPVFSVEFKGWMSEPGLFQL